LAQMREPGVEDEYEIEHSPLSADVTRDGMTVQVRIYRLKDRSEGWSLEVVDHEGASTVWDELFQTDNAAFDEFVATVNREGIGCFLRAPETRLN
jgi:hypothetical protein